MAVAKKAATKTAKKTVTRAKATPKKNAAKGDTYACHVCGLVVTVDESCGYTGVCDILCCGEPMKAKKTAK